MGIVVFLITTLCIVLLLMWVMMQPQSKILQGSIWICFFSFITILIIHCVADFNYDLDVMNVPMAFKAITSALLSLTNGVSYSDVVESANLSFITENSFYFFIFETLFWICHFLFIFTVALGGFALLGRRILDKIRRALHMRFHPEKVYHIFGDTYGALLLGRNITKDENKAALIVYYTSSYSEQLHEEIADFSGALIEVSEKTKESYNESAEKKSTGNVVEITGEHDIYANGYSIAELYGRKVVHDLQPLNQIRELVETNQPIPPRTIFVVGLAELGLACTKWLIMNSQYASNGELPTVCLIDRDSTKIDRFLNECPSIDICANIKTLAADIYSQEAKKFIDEQLDAAKSDPEFYVTCTPVVANDQAQEQLFLEENHRIAEYLKTILKQTGKYNDVEPFVKEPLTGASAIWTEEVLLHKSLDEEAIKLNGYYKREYDCDYAKSYVTTLKHAKELWNLGLGKEGCDKCKEATLEFHKNSSRAAADFNDTFRVLAGVDIKSGISTEEFENMQDDKKDLLWKLGIIEHARWSAFHAVNGYSAMDPNVYIERLSKKIEHPNSAQQDFEKLQHVCLINWDELPRIDVIAGKPEGTQQQKDIDNIKCALVPIVFN